MNIIEGFNTLKNKMSQRVDNADGYRDVENEGYYGDSNAVTEEEAGIGYYEENDRYEQTNRSPIGIHRIPAGNLNIIQPTCIQDVIHDVVRLLKDDSIVILNLTKLENSQRMRIVDFVTGVVAALDGTIVEASPFTYTATPKSITVSAESQAVEGVDSYMNGTNS